MLRKVKKHFLFPCSCDIINRNTAKRQYKGSAQSERSSQQLPDEHAGMSAWLAAWGNELRRRLKKNGRERKHSTGSVFQGSKESLPEAVHRGMYE